VGFGVGAGRAVGAALLGSAANEPDGETLAAGCSVAVTTADGTAAGASGAGPPIPLVARTTINPAATPTLAMAKMARAPRSDSGLRRRATTAGVAGVVTHGVLADLSEWGWSVVAGPGWRVRDVGAGPASRAMSSKSNWQDRQKRNAPTRGVPHLGQKADPIRPYPGSAGLASHRTPASSTIPLSLICWSCFVARSKYSENADQSPALA